MCICSRECPLSHKNILCTQRMIKDDWHKHTHTRTHTNTENFPVSACMCMCVCVCAPALASNTATTIQVFIHLARSVARTLANETPPPQKDINNILIKLIKQFYLMCATWCGDKGNMTTAARTRCSRGAEAEAVKTCAGIKPTQLQQQQQQLKQ